MKYLPLSQGFRAIVDNCDYKRSSKYKWHAEISKDKLRVYARTDMNGKKVRLHRFIMDAKTNELIDHIGGNSTTLDCRRKNLRRSNKSQNAANSKLSAKNTSGFRGVHFHPETGKWRASVVINRKRKSLGLHESPQMASEIVEAERKIQWG